MIICQTFTKIILTFESRLLLIIILYEFILVCFNVASAVEFGSDSSSPNRLGQLILFILMACSNASRDSIKQKVKTKLLILLYYYNYYFYRYFITYQQTD